MQLVFFFKQKTAYEMRISDWSSDVCSSDLIHEGMMSGAMRMVPRSDAFGPCFRRVEAQVRPYDLGFGGPQLKRLKVVENLRPGSEAAKAGLRNGDRLDYSDRKSTRLNSSH